MRDEITITDNNTPRWTGRSIELLTALKAQLAGRINHLTAGWILEKLHDDSGDVPDAWKAELRRVLKNYPGYPDKENGLYSYTFLRQLEFVCENCRVYADEYAAAI